jgi:16S rRNA (guanine527-N7)-methyltransferase
VFHVKHDDITAAAKRLGITLGPAQAEQLAVFEDELCAHSARLGLIAGRDASILRERHILDSLRAAPLVAGRVVDLGSGAGLPGIVLAIARPEATIDLVDSRRRRVAFLELVVERLRLTNAVPVLARVEDISDRFDTATARAFAPAAASWDAAEHLLISSGRLIYFAGARFHRSEIEGLSVRAEFVQAPPPLASSGPLVIMSRQ